MSLKLGRSGKDEEAASAEAQEVPSQPTTSDTESTYADSGVAPEVPANPTFSAVWGTPAPSATSEDSGDLDDSDQTHASDTPETPVASEDSSVQDIPDAPEAPDAAEPTSSPDASDMSSAPKPATDDGRLSVAARLEEAAGDLDRPLLPHVAGLRASWQRIQFGFVDDPHEAVQDAADLVEHTAQALAAALQQRHRLLRSLWDSNRPLDDLGSAPASVPPQAQPAGRSRPADNTLDTEDLRLLMQRYRTMFNEICRP